MAAATYIEWNQSVWLADRLKEDKNYFLALLVKLGTNLGLRFSDLSKLTWNDILRDKIILTETKTKKHRTLILNPAAKEFCDEIKDLLKQTRYIDDSQYIFRNRAENKPVSIHYTNRMLDKMKDQYFIEHPISTHTLRKTFGRRVYELNPSETTLILLSDIFNHADIKTTKRYLGIRLQEILDVYVSIT
jgi:integrase